MKIRTRTGPESVILIQNLDSFLIFLSTLSCKHLIKHAENLLKLLKKENLFILFVNNKDILTF